MKYENKIKIAFLGGDMRAATAAKKLADTSARVCAWGVPRQEVATRLCYCDNMTEALIGASAVILPLPASLDGYTLNFKTADEENKTSLTAIADEMEKSSIIIGGKLPRVFAAYAQGLGIKTFDYFESESFQIKNAYTTAEAALNIAMNNMTKNIRGAKFAVTGYGRISKQLTRLLTAIGGRVTVAARKDSDLALAELEGCRTLKLYRDPISELASGYDVIFNTVPDILFDEIFLCSMDKNTLVIELASSPGGVDVAAAKKLHSKVLWAPSLPGKYAPDSAGELIAGCISDIIRTEVRI